MSFGGGGQKTQKTTTEYVLSPEQRALIKPAVSAGQKYAKNPPTLLPGSQVAPFNPNQTAAQQLLLGATLPQSMVAGQAAGANQFLLGDVLDPQTNPHLRSAINAAVRPINENYLETILPGIRGEAITAGQLGGSRQGIAEGIAARGTQRQVADTAATMANQGYQSGLDAMTKGLALTPQTLQGLTVPGLTTGAVGDVQRGMSQQLLDEQAYKHMYAQMAPWLAAKEVAAVGAGLPGGTNVSTTPNPVQQSNPLGQALGLGSLALGLIPGMQPFAAMGSAASGLMQGGLW